MCPQPGNNEKNTGFVVCFICNKRHVRVICTQVHTEGSESPRISNESSTNTEHLLSKESDLT